LMVLGSIEHKSNKFSVSWYLGSQSIYRHIDVVVVFRGSRISRDPWSLQGDSDPRSQRVLTRDGPTGYGHCAFLLVSLGAYLSELEYIPRSGGWTCIQDSSIIFWDPYNRPGLLVSVEPTGPKIWSWAHLGFEDDNFRNTWDLKFTKLETWISM
jgi:hypothetical protein